MKIPLSLGRFAVSIVCLVLAPSLTAAEPAAPASQPAQPQAPPHRQHIFFFGDSITRAGGYVKQIKAELIKQSPTQPPVIHNFGHNSETVSNLSEAYHPGRRPCILNWLDTVVAEKPDLAIACYGINDGIYHPFNEKRFAAYQTGIEKLIAKFNAVGTHVVLLTPPPFAASGPAFPPNTDAAAQEVLLAKANELAEAEAEKDPKKFGYRTAYPYYDHVLARYSKWLVSLGDRQGVSVVDIRTPLLARIKETHGGDAIHPNGTGHAIMAATVLKEWPAIQTKMKTYQAKFKADAEAKAKADRKAPEKTPGTTPGTTPDKAPGKTEAQ